MKGIKIVLVLFLGACTHSKKEVSKPPTQKSDLEIGDSLLYVNPLTAFTYYKKAVDSKGDSLYKAAGYQRMANVQYNLGDYWNCEETALESLKLLDEKNKKHLVYLAAGYNLLGNNALALKLFETALQQYDRAISFATNDTLAGIYTNNKGVVSQKMQDYETAISFYEAALARVKNVPIENARVISNLAKCRWQKNPAYDATAELMKALAIRQKENDVWGLNASYSHLADYYSVSRPDSALNYARKMYAHAQWLNSPEDKAEALEKLIRLSPVKQKGFFIDYLHIKDSLQDARNNAKNQFTLIRYETQKNKDDNLRLQQKTSRQRTILVGAVLGFILVLAIIVFSYRKRRQKLQWESANAIRENQLKTSKKVHDVVANGLYRIMADIEHKDEIGKEILLDKIEVLYEQSRDLSYEQPQDVTGDFSGEINAMLNSFATSTTRILTVGNGMDLWRDIQPGTRKELEYVLQELMVNMSKHSQARNVVVSFERQAEHIRVHYKDDGIGFAAGTQQGNGLRNTGNRIQGMGGTIIFDSSPGKGLTVEILVPISKTA